MSDVERYEQLQMGAEFLAELTSDRIERADHLRMAGVYCLRACRAGSLRKPGLTH